MTSYTNAQFLNHLSELIKIPSVKSKAKNNAPFGVHTVEALKYMLNLATSMGFVTKNLDNMVGYIEWGQGEKMIAILAHLDVVPAGDNWTVPPFELTDSNDYLWGRGIVDNKGPAMCALYALLRLKESDFTPNCRIRIIFGLDEEHGSSCISRYLLSEEAPNCGFTPDADFPVIYAEKGILQIELYGKSSGYCTIKGGEAANVVPSSCSLYHIETDTRYSAEGRSAHASTPHDGLNAILKLVRSLPNHIIQQEKMLAFISDNLVNLPDAQSLIIHYSEDESGKLTVNPAQINIDAQKCNLVLDIRYPVHCHFDSILKEIIHTTKSYALNVDIINHLPPLFLDKNSDLVTSLLSVYKKYIHDFFCEDPSSIEYVNSTLSPVQAVSIGGGTYARSMSNIVAFGPCTPWLTKTMHQKDERFPKKDMLLLINIYKDAIQALCGQFKK